MCLNPHRKVVAELNNNLREMHEYANATIVNMMSKLEAQIKSSSSTIPLDPDGAGTDALEQADEYFKRECEKLRRVRRAVDLSGAASMHGQSVFSEIEKLIELLTIIVGCLQSVRWEVLIHDGTLSPTSDRACGSGRELISALNDS